MHNFLRWGFRTYPVCWFSGKWRCARSCSSQQWKVKVVYFVCSCSWNEWYLLGCCNLSSSSPKILACFDQCSRDGLLWLGKGLGFLRDKSVEVGDLKGVVLNGYTESWYNQSLPKCDRVEWCGTSGMLSEKLGREGCRGGHHERPLIFLTLLRIRFLKAKSGN